jgi:glutaminyl-peptide cyclotransferase
VSARTADRDRVGRWQLRTWRAEVIQRVTHPGRGFTQGLIAGDGRVYESTGGYGVSALCRYRLGARQVEHRAEVPAEYFAEGIGRVGDVIWQLTWRERIALKWDAATLELIERVPYNREGWGLCVADGYVVTSDGSSELVRRDPQTLQPQAVIHVRSAGARVQGLNDLAWSAGTVWANVAGTHYLAGIDPDSGEVTDIVNARPAAERHLGNPQAIMNGIAALPAKGEFLLTGKGWRSIRHVRLKLAREKSALERVLGGLAR